ncbi:MAG: hypothetical protein GX287_00875 [Fusobacteria bacterium]|nr:hypothetical protein [Fusobacteriota bacterium]
MKEVVENFEENALDSILQILKIFNTNKESIIKAKYIQELFENNNIINSIIDKEGNVIGKIGNNNKSNKEIIISAGLDFPHKENNKTELTLKNAIAPNISNAVALYGLIFIGKLLNNSDLNCSVILAATSGSQYKKNGIKYLLQNKNKANIKGYINIKGEGLGEINTHVLSSARIKIIFKSKDQYDKKNDKKIALSINDFYYKINGEYVEENADFEVENIYYNKEECSNEGYILLKITSKNYNKLLIFLNIIKDLAIGIAVKHDLNHSLLSFGETKGSFPVKSELEEIFKEESKNLNLNTLSKYVNSEISEALLLGIDSINVGISEIKNKNSINESVNIMTIYEGIYLVYNSIIKLDKS